MKHVAIKYPSEACLKHLESLRKRPAITEFEDVTSKLKKSFCAELLRIQFALIMIPHRHDPNGLFQGLFFC